MTCFCKRTRLLEVSSILLCKAKTSKRQHGQAFSSQTHKILKLAYYQFQSNFAVTRLTNNLWGWFKHAYKSEKTDSRHLEQEALLPQRHSAMCYVSCQSAYDFLLAFDSNYVHNLYHIWHIERYWSKIANFNLSHMYLTPPVGVTMLEFRRDCWNQKTRVPVLSMA